MSTSRMDQVRAFVNFILDGDPDLKTVELDNATPDLKNENTVWGDIAYSLYGQNVPRFRNRLYSAWNRESQIPIRKEVLKIVGKENRSKQKVIEHLHQTNENKTKVNVGDDDCQEVLIKNINTEESTSASPLGADVIWDTSVLTQSRDNCAFLCSTPKNIEFTSDLPSIDFSRISKRTAANVYFNKSIHEEVLQSVSHKSITVAVNEDSNQLLCQSFVMSSVSLECQEMNCLDKERTYVVDNTRTHNAAVKRFDLILTVEECNLVFVKDPALYGMRTGWTEVISDKLNEAWPYCALTFRYHHFRKKSSRKKQSPFWMAKAHCRTKLCIKVDLRINDEPVREENVILQVTVIGTCTHLGKDNCLQIDSVLPNRRFLSGNKRRLAADLCMKTGTKARVYCNKKLSEMTYAEIIAGHRTKCQTPEVVRQAVYEQKNKSNLHENVITELFLMMQTWHAALGTSISGFIQGLGYMPFYVIFYLQEQVQLYIEACRSHDGCILHCDSTGSVVRDQVCESSGVKAQTFLYTFLMNSTNIPAFSFLSNRHDADWICGKINIFMKHVRKSAGMTVKPRYVVVDFSFAFIYSSLMVWNRQDLLSYLFFCYKVLLFQEGSETIMSHTYVCLCAAHMLKAVSMRLSRKECNPKKRKVVMTYFAILQRCTTLQAAKNLFSNIQVVLCTERNNKHVKRAKAEIMDLLNATPLLNDEVDTAMEEEAEGEEAERKELEPFPDFATTHGKLKASSPFTRLFEECKRNEFQQTDDLMIELNHSHSPSGFTIIESFAYIFPLWNNALQNDIQKFSKNCGRSHTAPEHQRCRTNGQIEAHFRFIKHDLLGGRSRFRPSIFLNKYLMDIRGRINETMMPCIGRNRKRKREMLSVEEKWKRKRQKQSKYTDRKNAINRLKKIDTTVDRAQYSNYCDSMVLIKGTQSIMEAVTSEGIVKNSSVDNILRRDEFFIDLDDNRAQQKSTVDDILKRDEFLPDLDDNMAQQKSTVDDILTRDEFLPDLDDNMALSLIHKSFTGDRNYEKELDSNNINRALLNLRDKFPKVHGLQPVDFGFSCKGKSLPQFDPEPSTFVQVLNIGDHWVCVSNIFSKQMNEVYVYDSFYDHPNEELIVQLTSLLRTLIKPDSITINMRPFCKQETGSRTCGYYALGAAVFICNGFDPSGLEFKIETLIMHVMSLIDEKKTTIIPATRSENNQSSVTKHKKLHCLCHGKSTPELMICCSVCSNWYHEKCVNVDSYVKESVDVTWNGPCCIGYSDKQRELKKKRLQHKLLT